ncbi:MAG: hypothetical protein LWW92_03740 [Rhodocyclales bacterium]|nr:hypothetical protein [Rhodocyclales bacterium]
MLAPRETLLRPALQAALGPSQDVRSGPGSAPSPASTRVALHAARLTPAPLPDGESPARDPAYLSWSGTLSPVAGHPLDYTLPDQATGHFQEVQNPPGHILGHGDAFLVEGRTLHFFQPPQGPVQARTRDQRCAGYTERRPAHVLLALRSWAPDAATADSLLARSLAAMLGLLERINVLDFTGAPPTLGMRLSKPRPQLLGLERGMDGSSAYSVAHYRIDGELELALSLGQAEPEGRIQAVDIQLQRTGVHQA